MIFAESRCNRKNSEFVVVGQIWLCFIFTVVLLFQTLEVQYKQINSTCHEGPVITIIKAVRNILNQGISSEALWWHVLYNTASNTGIGNIQPFSTSKLLGTDKQQKWHWTATADQHTEEWILKLKPNSFVPVEECVLESSFPSFNSLYDTLTGKQSSLHFSKPVVLEMADFMNSEPNSGLRVAVLSYQVFSPLLLTHSSWSRAGVEGRTEV